VGWEEVININNKDTSLAFVVICVRLRPLSTAVCLFLQKTDRYLHDSNKSSTRCKNFTVYYPDVYLQLNMFRAFSRPSSGAQ